jgi:3alpha(or 20beta)-hydroxysteroid dehydrogenase
MNSSLSGKTALVTGASQGLGRAIADTLRSRGVSVAACDLAGKQQTPVPALQDQPDTLQLDLDVTSESDWNLAVQKVLEWRGSIDILVNNAGIIKRHIVSDYPADEFRQVIDVNLVGPFLGMKAIAPIMAKQGRGSIINIASNAASASHPDPAYSASKWGLRGMTTTAAIEFARDGVRVNSVSPGLVLTDINRGGPHLDAFIGMTPIGRAGTPADIAEAVCFLASDQAQMITGEDILIDGGLARGGVYFHIASEAKIYPPK